MFINSKMISLNSRVKCLKLFGRQFVASENAVLPITLSGRHEFQQGDQLDAVSMFENDKAVKLKVLHCSHKKGVTMRKKRRKRHERRVGFRKTVVLLKLIS